MRKARSAAKSKAKVPNRAGTPPPPPQRPVATPVRKGHAPSVEGPEPTPAHGASGNPAAKKRHRMKQPDEDKDRQIHELKQARLGLEI